MPGYIEPPLETDPDELADEALDYLIANIPGFVPQEGHLEVWLITALARMVAEARDVASAVPTSIFRYFGKTLLGLAPIDAAPAKTASTWVMRDNLGYTIPAGALVAFRTAGDELVTFSVDADVIVPAGQTQTTAGQVLLSATESGTHANGIAAGVMELVDALAFVLSVTATSPTTSGGVDAESDDDYLDRLREELQITTPAPILPADFAILARRTAGVHRATAIDGWNPNTSTSNNARTITVAVVDAAGNPVVASVKTAVEVLLESMREINWEVFVRDPTYTDIDVVFTVKVKAGYTPATVEVAAEAAVAAYFSQASWGGGKEDPPTWRNETIVRYLEVAAVINAVDGVDHITTTGGNYDLTVEGGRVDVVMAGVAPLTRAGVINGTAVA